jgi:hypothetical protein
MVMKQFFSSFCFVFKQHHYNSSHEVCLKLNCQKLKLKACLLHILESSHLHIKEHVHLKGQQFDPNLDFSFNKRLFHNVNRDPILPKFLNLQLKYPKT